jgi:hypothetical protein
MVAFLDGAARASGWAGAFVGALYLLGGRNDLAFVCMVVALAGWAAYRALTRRSHPSTRSR